MLKQRILTAVALLAVLLPALFYPRPEPFCALALLIVTVAGWEWGTLCGLSRKAAAWPAAACAGLCLLSWQQGLLHRASLDLWLAWGALWVLGSAVVLRAGALRWMSLWSDARLAIGVFGLWLAWLAMAQARIIGVNFLLSILMLVWVADIGAYFAGRRYGLRKLAPSISPGKSWEGVWGGLLAVTVMAFGWKVMDETLNLPVTSLYTQLAAAHRGLLLLGVAFLVAMSVVGDLTESLVKRGAEVKDSSQLLPGHGGVLDRIDALLPVLPLAMLLASL